MARYHELESCDIARVLRLRVQATTQATKPSFWERVKFRAFAAALTVSVGCWWGIHAVVHSIARWWGWACPW